MAKRDLKLEWKEHNVDLPAFDAWCRANVPCDGISADTHLTVHLTDDAEEHVAEVEAMWAELDDAEHEMCASYRPAAELEAAAAARVAAIRAKKILMVDKTWAQMSTAERKLVMGLDSEVTDAELGL